AFLLTSPSFCLYKSLDNMLLEEVSTVASSSLSEGSSGRVPIENGLVAPAPKFKQRKVSSVGIFRQGAAGWLHQSLDQ
ncbi:hypothetical protein J1N35_034359, partial [Gossypium stocksii]